MKDTKTLCVRLENEMYDVLDSMAKDWGINISTLVRKLMLMYILENTKGSLTKDEDTTTIQ